MTLNKTLYLLVEMGHHALAWRSTSLSWQWGSYGSMGGWMRGSVGGLRENGLKEFTREA